MAGREVTWKLEPREGGWLIDQINAEVTQIFVDFAFSITIDQQIHLRIETEFEYFDGAGLLKIDPDPAPNQAPLLTLFNCITDRVLIDDEPERVRVDFADGRWIRTIPHPWYESFSLNVPGSGPGGAFIGSPS